MAYTNCEFWQSQLDEQEKNLAKYKAFGKLPEGVLFSPYVTYSSFISDKEKSIAKLKNDININDCANDPSVKKYKRDRCLKLNQSIKSYVNQIASDYNRLLLSNDDNIKMDSTEKLKGVLEKAKEDFVTLKCASEVEASRQEVVSGIVSEYSSYDKERIDEESKYESKKRIYLGAFVLVFGLAMIITFKGSKLKN
jgi:hypothetical protein